jgi:hypothetical protein
VQPAIASTAHLALLCATEGLPSTSTVLYVETSTIVRPATRKSGRRQHSKQRLNGRFVKLDVHLTRISWPIHFLLLFTSISLHLRGMRVDDKGLTIYGDLPHCSSSDSIIDRDLSGERVFIDSPWEHANEI